MMIQELDEDILDLDLGFSDLEEDEAFMVWLYRHWQTAGAAPSGVEGELRDRLTNDRVHGCLDLVFGLFRQLGPDPVMNSGRMGAPVLTSRELALLHHLSQAREAEDVFACCARALTDAGTRIRRPDTIPTSSIDRIEWRIAQSYSAVWRIG